MLRAAPMLRSLDSGTAHRAGVNGVDDGVDVNVNANINLVHLAGGEADKEGGRAAPSTRLTTLRNDLTTATKELVALLEDAARERGGGGGGGGSRGKRDHNSRRGDAKTTAEDHETFGLLAQMLDWNGWYSAS